ncbi:hypothetical protein GLA29479_687 [Lysobacter antibioticus]|nr:hypothetical protein GLA29479_687 [Lysobacter antibioticus]
MGRPNRFDLQPPRAKAARGLRRRCLNRSVQAREWTCRRHYGNISDLEHRRRSAPATAGPKQEARVGEGTAFARGGGPALRCLARSPARACNGERDAGFSTYS